LLPAGTQPTGQPPLESTQMFSPHTSVVFGACTHGSRVIAHGSLLSSPPHADNTNANATGIRSGLRIRASYAAARELEQRRIAT